MTDTAPSADADSLSRTDHGSSVRDELPPTITRAQLVAAITALGLDPEVTHRVLLTPTHVVTVTWVAGFTAETRAPIRVVG